MATAPPPTQLDPERVTKQFRIDPTTWQTFTSEAGEKNASTILRRLVSLYLRDDKLQKRVLRTPDPAPDRRRP